jgi:uncharacterized membrane protein YgdD (TMEM256/DUF423 family)
VNSAARGIALAAALLSLSVVVLAALGSHSIDMRGLQSSWQSAISIHMFTAAALIGLAALLANTESRFLRWGAWFIVLGSVVFCGSIYLHIIADVVQAGVAPIGGLLMMAGWALVVIAMTRKT